MNASVTSLLENITSLELLVEKQSILIEQLHTRTFEESILSQVKIAAVKNLSGAIYIDRYARDCATEGRSLAVFGMT